ncbi:MAG: DUF4358 domain-containing protein [Ruminiclostridium sp.]|nr:DUF4358 domain-containing protein [Ruminiclostridium sp.]
MKRKIICALLLAALVCGAASCGGDKPAATTTKAAETTAAPKPDASAGEIASAVLEAVPINSAFEKKKESLEDYFDDLKTDSIVDSSYYICASGAYPDEIAIFRFDSADSAKNAVAAVENRLEYQKSTYKDYTPAEYYKLEDAVIEQRGEWLIYTVTSDNAKAKDIALGFIA